ncbi:DNA-directed RNA polymerase RPB5 subunit eukaryote/virus [Carpediemonas membranifera]|uniref:DNA-directed RNA polymerase RPB5 subunit eukaryote/virus n=1 Tax=Carpediemonas membranifera TaxID=201153 RepID=A0A8J6BW99_9EUKA|nr:DNA-directed RNA polymerase RPB5 subunit eukaryote/virus [Carpediemonas membranifera]|eukprot:KAG9392226.1 DNA-directed RNA polymerase RPB5 subunit eukaryote/virus [Carpediemonas membranifera]
MNEELSNVFRVQRTVFEMLRDRGFKVREEDLTMDFATFKDHHAGNPQVRDALTIETHMENDPEDNIRVIFDNSEKRLTVKMAETAVKNNISTGTRRCIMIGRQAISPAVEQFAEKVNLTSDTRLDLFCEEELIVNITKHVLVPLHIRLTDEQKKELFKRYRIDINNATALPRLLKKDPVRRYYGFEKGDVIKIVRSSETAGRYISYRIVV